MNETAETDQYRECTHDYFSNLDEVKADFDSFKGLNQMTVRTNRLSRSQWKLEALDLCRFLTELLFMYSFGTDEHFELN